MPGKLAEKGYHQRELVQQRIEQQRIANYNTRFKVPGS